MVEFSPVWKSWHTIGAQFFAVHSALSVVAMTWKIRRDVLEKKTSERSNSALEARAVFPYSVQDLRPDVVTDLWAKAFKEFTRVVAHRFRRELLVRGGRARC